MNDETAVRNEYIKFFVLLLCFAALMLGAAALRPVILGQWKLTSPPATAMPVPSPLPTPTAIALPTAEPTPTVTPTAQPTLPPSAPQTHVVQAGDNLYRIGLQYNCSVEQLVAANSIANRHQIFVGQTLVLPGGDPPPAATSASTPAPPAPPPAQRTYMVQWGDTLWRISHTFGVELAALAAANHIADPSLIRVGQVLVIP